MSRHTLLKVDRAKVRASVEADEAVARAAAAIGSNNARMCASCFDPGACCRKMTLSAGGGELTFHLDRDPAVQLAERYPGQPVPFTALGEKERAVDDAGSPYASFWWSCPKVTPAGLCSIYENRPLLCRLYRAGSDQLCVHYQPLEGDAG